MPEPSPTIVLVHGAFTDASVWNGVTQRLQLSGADVLAPALPMRGLESDATYLAGVLNGVTRPVVLVAHSYAGAVISHPRIAPAADIRQSRLRRGLPTRPRRSSQRAQRKVSWPAHTREPPRAAEPAGRRRSDHASGALRRGLRGRYRA